MRIVFWAALVGFGLVGAAAAETAGTAQEQAACRPDVRKLCGHISKGEADKYRECLQTHFSELSPKCRDVMKNH